MKNLLLLTTAIFVLPTAYDNKNGWKLDDDGKLELKDGNPIYIQTDGKEMSVEAGTISRLNGEAQSNREALQAANVKLKTYEGIDPEIARKAIEDVKKLDSKKLIDAGEVDRVKEEIKQQYVAQTSELQTALDASNAKIDSMVLDTAFAKSKFISERVATPEDMFRASMSGNFKVEDGKVIPLNASGEPLMSKSRIGERATFDEAIEIFVDNRTDKESILREKPKSGSGNGGDGGHKGKDMATITKADYNAMSASEMAAAGQKMAAGKLELTD